MRNSPFTMNEQRWPIIDPINAKGFPGDFS